MNRRTALKSLLAGVVIPFPNKFGESTRAADLVEVILRRYREAKTHRDPWTAIWSDLATQIRPIRDGINGTVSSPSLDRHSQFDTTAQNANLVYAAGCLAWLTPADKPWFRLEAPRYLEGNENVASWLMRASEEMTAEFAASNFFGEIHECYLEDGAFGTSGIHCEEDSGLHFEAYQIGDFAVLEDHRGRVDTIFREIELTPRNAAKKYGEANLSEEMRKLLAENDKSIDRNHVFLHCIYPRGDARTPGKLDAGNMPWASIHLDLKAKHVVRESGYWELPAAVARHLKWGKSPYGFAPSWNALADARQLNALQMNLDVLAELAAFPPYAVPSKLEGEIDLRARGQTFVDDINQRPTPIGADGNYAIGMDRVEMRQRSINRAFHVDLFNLFELIPPGKEMTALEVQARLDDKLTLFSPTFAKKTTELISPIIRRAFGIMLRAGAFGQPPAEMQHVLGNGMLEIADPEIRFTSRIALALERVHNAGLARTMADFGPLFEVRPDLIDNLDIDEAFRESARNNGMAEDWLRDTLERDQMREQRAEAEAEMMAQQLAAGAAA